MIGAKTKLYRSQWIQTVSSRFTYELQATVETHRQYCRIYPVCIWFLYGFYPIPRQFPRRKGFPDDSRLRHRVRQQNKVHLCRLTMKYTEVYLSRLKSTYLYLPYTFLTAPDPHTYLTLRVDSSRLQSTGHRSNRSTRFFCRTGRATFACSIASTAVSYECPVARFTLLVCRCALSAFAFDDPNRCVTLSTFNNSAGRYLRFTGLPFSSIRTKR
jgi:hypothetical protein